jgi:hypothetical protein
VITIHVIYYKPEAKAHVGNCKPVQYVVKGRMKFCRPVFKAVHKVDPELSVAVFSKSKSAFPIARKLTE